MSSTLSLIIPTIGRSTLPRVIADAVKQMHKGDSIVVVYDPVHKRPPWEIESEERAPGVALWTYVLPKPAGDFGCTACDFGIEKAYGDHVFFIGDDDRVPDGALDTIRAGVSTSPDLPHLFAMQHTGRILANSLVCGEVSGQQIVVPRDMKKMPKMADHRPGELAVSDWRFIQNVEAAWGKIVMHSGIIAVLPRMNQGRMM